MKYSLWKLDHESPYRVSALKVKNTNSDKEVDEWMEKNWDTNVASFYREEEELNADYLQTFEN